MKAGAMHGAGRVLRLLLLGLGLLGLWPASGWAAEAAVALAWFPTQSPTNPTVVFPFATTERLRANATPSTGATVVKVEYYAGTILIGTATAGSTYYALYLASTSIGPGVYSLTSKVTDSLGAVATSAAVNFTVNARPTVSLTSPGANQVFASSAPIMLSATAADSDGTITRVDFYRGSVLIGTATSLPHVLTWSNGSLGSHSLTAKAMDNLGAATTSAAVPITVIANSPPTVSLTSPTPNQSLTAPATINLAADASDPDNNLVKVEFFQNGSLIATVLSAPYTATWNNVGQGSYQITAIATDAAGAQTTSAPITLTVTSAQANLYFIHADHLGTPRLVTDSANQVVWRHLPTTEPFGNTPPEEDPNATGHRFEMPLAFPGQYRDNESGLSYNYFRDYSSGEGRYRQSDPIGLQGGINTYTYVDGNPISYIDPEGLSRANPFDPNRFGGGAGGGGGGRICPPVSKGARTEPTLPPKTVVNENGVTVQHYTKSGDHAPAHLHVKGGGPETKIGQNGHPIKGSPEPTPTQQSVIDANKSEIRRAVEKMQRWFDFMRNN